MIRSAKVASLASHAASYGMRIQGATVDMAGVRQRKRTMVDALSIWSSFWAQDSFMLGSVGRWTLVVVILVSHRSDLHVTRGTAVGHVRGVSADGIPISVAANRSSR